MDKHYIFKPVSVQALWTAIQTLHVIMARLLVSCDIHISSSIAHAN